MSKRKLRSALKQKLNILLNVDVKENVTCVTIASDVKIFKMFQGKRTKKRVSYPSKWYYHNGKDTTQKQIKAFSDIEKANRKIEKENLKFFSRCANKQKMNNR